MIYTGLSNMKVNISNPKKWPKYHWFFQEQPSWLLQLCPQQMRTRMVSSSCIPFNDPKSVGLFCREHFPEYTGLLHPMETYNAAVGVKGAKPKVFNSRGEQTCEPCVGDMTSNGLWFTPECFCLRTDKYQDISNKACRHPWIEERLNLTGRQ